MVNACVICYGGDKKECTSVGYKGVRGGRASPLAPKKIKGFVVNTSYIPCVYNSLVKVIPGACHAVCRVAARWRRCGKAPLCQVLVSWGGRTSASSVGDSSDQKEKTLSHLHYESISEQELRSRSSAPVQCSCTSVYRSTSQVTGSALPGFCRPLLLVLPHFRVTVPDLRARGVSHCDSCCVAISSDLCKLVRFRPGTTSSSGE